MPLGVMLEITQTSTLAPRRMVWAPVFVRRIRQRRSQRAAVALKGHLPISRRLNDEGRAKRDRYAACELAGALFPNLPSF